MPLFIRPVRLRGTRLFGAREAERHVLVVEVDAESASDNALVVPVPSAEAAEMIASSELALGWDGRRRFFEDLDVWYFGPAPGRPGGGQAFFGMPTASPTGPTAQPVPAPTRIYPSYEASLDAVRLFASAEALPLRPGPKLDALLRRRYQGHALALCPFPAGFGRIMVALRYRPLDSTHFFFPILQVTDGSAPAAQISDEHDVLAQGVELLERVRPDPELHPPLVPVTPPPLPSFVQPEAPLDVALRRGLRENDDLRAPVR